MSTKSERAFAWVGVGIAVLSTVALSAAVIIQQIITDKNNANTTPTLACVDNNTEQTLPVPAVYTSAAPVTDLQVTDLSTGSGNGAKAGDCLMVKYYGTLLVSGQEFDENFSTTKGFAFTLGQGNVIPGWDQGLVGMKAGGERRLVIPAALGYGSQSTGAIPANSVLVFVVKLLRIQ